MPHCIPDSEANCIHQKRFTDISVAECLEYSIFASILKIKFKLTLNTCNLNSLYKFMHY